MGFSVLTNVASLGAQSNLAKTSQRLGANIQRLSSGKRINRSGDDAAGLAISSKMSAHIRGLSQARRNAQDAVSLIQTAEGSLSEINGLLTRMRELAVQAANGGTLVSSDRSALNLEFEQLESEINRIVNVTKYNGSTLLNGAMSTGVDFQVGILNSTNDRITLSIATANSVSLAIDSNTVSTATNARLAITALDGAIASIAQKRNTLGATQNRLEVTMSNLSTIHENLSAAHSRIADVDVAAETAEMSQNQILMQAGVSVLGQANQMPSMVLSLLGQ
ncbi:MAG: flagellin [Myxococcota bacterium]|jgi:flagellin|nr:flagellin [Myxococcota bacterium]